jgi:hypothetical protein
MGLSQMTPFRTHATPNGISVEMYFYHDFNTLVEHHEKAQQALDRELTSEQVEHGRTLSGGEES